ncbi:MULTISPECIES: ImmA/IrrE family metallo-endopeptidase [unclassified Pseudoalteromonas]|uniref:ImmA/IrrE family metallo-endopeptidase n=1 Tax=unclassified Pseudoalteromonas TaxID=194690 RepID=UPI0025B45067|nr:MULTISPECIES: ImmA/IrrE family metallo-endopeptidase [unclassified Pseudoalteromonas]MDN3379317.1 ImmA/IrrE family metallo-endopeptidase [Pseudoalteromonas sp. APC 3893]MDN3386491.1 ImmA/IrrE family metallo-endopeptidase [Pseudoalteromonas sp. APC 4017]
MNYDKDDSFLTKYASDSFESFYNDYKVLKEHISRLPASIRSERFRNDDKYLHMAELQSGLSKGKKLLFRKKDDTNDYLVESWLAGVLNKAKAVELSFMTPEFKGLNKKFLSDFAKLSVNDEIYTHLPKLLFEKGIILIYEPSFDGLKLDGAVYKNDSCNPVIAMSLRYKRIDNFWFTLMHELAHIVLHYEQLDTMIIEDLDEKNKTLIEQEADRLAQDSLIKRNVWRGSDVRRLPSDENITKLASDLGIHQAIIAGRVQREINRYDLFRVFTDSCDVRQKVFG